jgi:hypothetical protein
MGSLAATMTQPRASASKSAPGVETPVYHEKPAEAGWLDRAFQRPLHPSQWLKPLVKNQTRLPYDPSPNFRGGAVIGEYAW